MTAHRRPVTWDTMNVSARVVSDVKLVRVLLREIDECSDERRRERLVARLDDC